MDGNERVLNKRTKEQREKDLRRLEQSLVEGLPVTQIVAAAVQQMGITERQVWRDLALIRERWRGSAALLENKEELQAHFSLALERRNLLFKEALKSGNLAVAHNVEKDRCELLGLYRAASIEVVHSQGGSSQQTVLKDILERLDKKGSKGSSV